MRKFEFEVLCWSWFGGWSGGEDGEKDRMEEVRIG